MPSSDRRRAALLLVIVLVAPTVALHATAAYRPVDEQRDQVEARSVSLIAPAVAELPDGTLRGVGMEMRVTVRDGTGGVYVDTRPLTQVDMQGSARLAATMATGLAGARMGDYDFFVTTRAAAPAVGGPSAGAAMTVAFAALLLELPLRDDVVITGMINPDGSVGPVGGILEKAEAADAADADLFLIPEGQAIVRRTVREVQDTGWFPTVTTREEQVNVTEHAEKEWGLEVREVADVYAAFELMTDHRLARPEVPDEPVQPLFGGVMRNASEDQVRLARDEHESLQDKLDTSDLATASPDAAAGLQQTLDRAAARIAVAGSAFANGSYYTASSRAFQSLVDLRIVDLWLQTIDAEDDRAFLQAAGEAAAERLEDVRGQATDAAPRTVSSLEAVGAAQVRVLEAERLLDQAELALGDDRLPETVELLGFAVERTRSVEWWLDIADRLAAEDGTARLAADPRDLASDYFTIAQQAVTYADVLLSQTGTDAATARLLQEATTSLQDAQTAQTGRLAVGALYLAMEAQVAAHGALSLVGGTDLLQDRVARQRDRALIQIATTRELGAEPFLAVSYLEFAGSLAPTQPVDALMMYGNAATIAATSRALATGELCGFGSASCDGEGPFVQRVNVPGPDPWTAYFALGTVILGFMAGVLVTLVVLQAKDRRHAPPMTASPPAVRHAAPHRAALPRHRAAFPPPSRPLAQAIARGHVHLHTSRRVGRPALPPAKAK